MANSSDKVKGVVQRVRNEDDTTVLELLGDVDMQSSPGLRTQLLKLVEGRATTIIVNLAEVEFMDSSGLATLVEALQATRQRGGKLKLVNLCPRVRSIFEIARLDAIFEIFDTEAEALA